MIGRILGEYRIIEEIGRGGMGVVYLAEHQRLKKKYALKVLPETLSRSRSFVERFHIEARVMADLDHRHIVKVHTLGKSEGYYYLVMDYITTDRGRAGSLQDEVEQRGRLPEKEVKGILLQVLSALDYAHNYRGEGAPEGVVHRDLKPSNILLGKGGRFLVSDFGLARVIGAEYIHSRIEQSISRSIAVSREGSAGHDRTLPAEDKSIGAESTLPGKEEKRTSTGSILGTYDYMSPEQKEGEEADERSDIYAVGVLTYQMLTGRKLTGFPENPSKIVKGIDKRWDRIIQKCLQIMPQDRYQSAGALIADIKRIGRSIRPMIQLAAIVVVLIAAGLFVTQRDRITKLLPKEKPYVEKPSVKKPSPEKVMVKKPAGKREVSPPIPAPEARPKFTGASITSTPPGAQVYFGSEFKGTTPIKKLKLDPGSYSLVIEKQGYASIVETLVVEKGREVKINRNLSVITGNIEVTARPAGVQIYLDGWDRGTSPQTIPGVVVGSHEITLKHKDYYEKKIKVEVKEKQTANIEATLQGLPGKVSVSSQPLGAKVYINGRDSGKETTATLDNISPGQVEIKVEKQGYRMETKKDTLNPKSSLTFNFILTWAAPQGLEAIGAATDPVSDLPLEVRSEKDGAEMVLIPAGEFLMGGTKADLEEAIGEVKDWFKDEMPPSTRSI